MSYSIISIGRRRKLGLKLELIFTACLTNNWLYFNTAFCYSDIVLPFNICIVLALI